MHHRVTGLLTQARHIPQAACRQLVEPLEAKVAQIEEQQGARAQSRQHGTGMHFAVLLGIGHIVNALP